MKLILFICIMIFIVTTVVGQDLKNYLSYRAGVEDYKGDIKCATKYDLQIKLQSQNLDKNLQNLLKLIPVKPVRSDSLRTTHFTLHWDETGTHAVPPEDISGNGIPDYIDSAAVILEHVWDVEINQMNYPPPPQQNGQPVSNYHVYFTDLYRLYGHTIGSGIDIQSLPGVNWTSYIELDNDYEESYYYSKGLNGLRITAAHEFHHAIEYGYNIRYDDYFFYEMTATWMEDVLYTDINDYYNYLSALFNEIGLRSFDYYTDYTLYPYGNCLYNHMAAEQYGNEFIKEVWDEIRSRPVIEALSSTLMNSKYNDTWINSLSDYGIWIYFTGNRAKPANYFPEGELYPQVNIKSNNTYHFADSLSFSSSLLSNSFNYFKVFGIKDKALQSIVYSDNVANAGHNLFSSEIVSDFLFVGDTLNGFITGEDSIIILITNPEDLGDSFRTNMRIVQNFVQIDSLFVQAKEGRNILSWSSFYEILNKQWIISRKRQNENYHIIHTIAGKEYSTKELHYNYIDSEIEEGIDYEYKLDVVFLNDSVKTIDSTNVSSLAPTKFALLQNNPNPFNNETSIVVEILDNTEIELIIYNTLGQKVKTLQKKQNKPMGFYLYKWMGDNDSGEKVASGVYFALLSSKSKIQNMKIVLIK